MLFTLVCLVCWFALLGFEFCGFAWFNGVWDLLVFAVGCGLLVVGGC